ncbi:MAG: hypothetical protein ABGF52_00945 [Candidatus Asgardarchaeum sp.]
MVCIVNISLMARYLLKRGKRKWHERLIISFIICFTFLYPLYNFEVLQNKMYFFVSSKSPDYFISTSQVNKVRDLKDVITVAEVSYKILNDTVLIEASEEMKCLVRRSLSKGRFPYTEDEIVVSNVLNKEIGDFIVFNGTKYKIVGILDSEGLEDIIGSDFLQYDILLKFSKKIERIRLLVIWLYLFANVTRVRKNIEELLEYKVIIGLVKVSQYEVEDLKIISITSLFATCIIAFLFLLNLRDDCAILFSVGWKFKYILFTVLIEYSLFFLLGYFLNLLFLAYITILSLKYILFLNAVFFVYYPLLVVLIDLFLLYFYAKVYVAKRFVEVLTR